eukprot:2201610-Rhodomonas_salina.2
MVGGGWEEGGKTMVRLGMCCWDSKVMALSAPAASVPPPREACGASYMALFAPAQTRAERRTREGRRGKGGEEGR